MRAEQPIGFPCREETLIGIIHDAASPTVDLGVIVVVGGPQYRVGSHRQFVDLARHLAAAGFCTLRFDTRGMGDSSGTFPGFEAIDDDIRAAIDALQAARPHLRRFVLWGLCDAASAILFYAHNDSRVAGITLSNPWVRSSVGYSQTQLRHYYASRVLNREFWKRFFSGRVDLVDAIRSFVVTVWNAFSGSLRKRGPAPDDETGIARGMPFPERMRRGLEAFVGPVLLVISGDDLTAREFDDMAHGSSVWRKSIARAGMSRVDLESADHTFSLRIWSSRVAAETEAFIKAIAERNE